jgi:hypothetical protein
MAENATASAWWEDVIIYHCKPPVFNLFVEESHFDGKGFEMIVYIDAHYNPVGAFDSHGYTLTSSTSSKPLTSLLLHYHARER